MHLGLARAQLLPRSDGYHRFTGSPIDALVYLVGLSCQIPIRLALRTIIHRRVAALPQRWPARRGDVRGGRLHPDVVQDVADFGAVGDEGNDAHLPTAHGLFFCKKFGLYGSNEFLTWIYQYGESQSRGYGLSPISGHLTV